jgi:hypothetical protein
LDRKEIELSEDYDIHEEKTGRGKILNIRNNNIDEIVITGKSCLIRMVLGEIPDATINPKILKQNAKWQKFAQVVLITIGVSALIALGYMGYLAVDC